MSLTMKDWVRLSQGLEARIKLGEGPVSSLQELKSFGLSDSLKSYIEALLLELQASSFDEVLAARSSTCSGLEERVFLETLRISRSGTSQLSLSLRSFRKFLRERQKLEKRLESAMFIPKAQGYLSILCVLFFSFVLPSFSGGLFPSFIEQNRIDLYVSGWALIFSGAGLLIVLSRWPLKIMKKMFERLSFFQFVALLIESGQDFESAWRQSAGMLSFSPSLKKTLLPISVRTQEFSHSLEEMAKMLSQPWPQYLQSLSFALRRGQSLRDFLEWILEEEKQDAANFSDSVVAKLSFLSLIPIGFMIFPGTLFLLIGPQFFQLEAMF